MKDDLAGQETTTITAAKVVDSRIIGVRGQQRGTVRVLQMAHAWSQGYQRGIDWVDVPLVDENGNPKL